MDFLDKLRAVTGQAAARAKEELDVLQTRRDLASATSELGHKAFDLVEAGQLSHAELDPLAERVRSLRAELDRAEAPVQEPAAEQAPAAAEPESAAGEPPAGQA